MTEYQDQQIELAARVISPNCMWDAGYVNPHVERRRDNARAKAREALTAANSFLPAAPESASTAPYAPEGIGAALLDIAIAASKKYTYSPDDGADHYPSDFERGLLVDFFLSLTGADDFNRILKRAQDAINAKARLFVAVDHTGCIHSSEDLERTIEIARANAGSVARLVGTDAPVSRAGLDVLAERQRQIDNELWTVDHDDAHIDGSIAQAAAAYAYAASGPGRDHGRLWPWDPKWWKPGAARRMLVKAAALLIAEIERQDRKALREESRG